MRRRLPYSLQYMHVCVYARVCLDEAVEIDEHITCKLEIRLDRVQTSWSLRVVRDDLAGTYCFNYYCLLCVQSVRTYS